tara:strand:+ start:270 stop:608 length:339 start_codon:yes stop_codon:yes gene_type:complete
MRNYCFLIAFISLTACAQSKWYHPSNTESDFHRNSMECQNYTRELELNAMEQDARQGKLIADAGVNSYASAARQEAYRKRQQAEYSLMSKLTRSFALKKQYSNCMKSLGYHN